MYNIIYYKMNHLPLVIENLILDYKYRIEFDEKYHKLLSELTLYHKTEKKICSLIPYFPSDKPKLVLIKQQLTKGINSIYLKRFNAVKKRMIEIQNMNIITEDDFERYIICEYDDCRELACIFYVLFE